MKNLIFIVLSISMLEACTTQDSKPIQKKSTQVETPDSIESEKTPVDPEIDALAMLLGGEQNGDSGMYKRIEQQSFWSEFQTKVNGMWKKTTDKLPVMKSWATKSLSDVNSEGGTLFYPFSGPDFLHADVFFSAYDNIIMVGLEPIGDKPDLLSKSDDTLVPYFEGINQSLNAILGLSFFRTVAMAEDFQGEVDGTLPILLHFMNRRGYEVLYHERLVLLSNGTLSGDLAQATDSSYFANRYYFKEKGTDKTKKLTYFSVNLQNTAYGASPGLSRRKDMTEFLKNENITASYLKSASYLLHRPSFSIVRDIILTESEFILQDDSGIPLNFFQADRWSLTFYGSYTKPISLFASRHQEDLKLIYETKDDRVKDLPFGIGYMYQKGTSNLMKAVRK